MGTKRYPEEFKLEAVKQVTDPVSIQPLLENTYLH